MKNRIATWLLEWRRKDTRNASDPQHDVGMGLGEKFVRLNLKNEMKSATGQVQLFEGHAYYQPSEAKCEGTWFDSRGTSFPIKCTVAGQSLTAMWGGPGQENGNSVYSFLDDKLEVVDSVKQKDGSWKEFGRFLMSRD